jgi:hypothetical protein
MTRNAIVLIGFFDGHTILPSIWILAASQQAGRPWPKLRLHSNAIFDDGSIVGDEVSIRHIVIVPSTSDSSFCYFYPYVTDL